MATRTKMSYKKNGENAHLLLINSAKLEIATMKGFDKMCLISTVLHIRLKVTNK